MGKPGGAVEYGQVDVECSPVVVTRADPVVLLPLERLRRLRDGVWCNASRVYVGNTRDGVEVIYQVAGWDADARALVMERVVDAEVIDPSELTTAG